MLREEASVLSSSFFNPSFMSLQRSHPIWLTAGHSPFKVAMATIQAKMLSGRYRCGYLTRHWSSSDGFVNYHLNVLISLRMLLIFYKIAPGLLKSDVILRILPIIVLPYYLKTLETTFALGVTLTALTCVSLLLIAQTTQL